MHTNTLRVRFVVTVKSINLLVSIIHIQPAKMDLIIVVNLVKKNIMIISVVLKNGLYKKKCRLK
jgi:hypothetical protein